jgi:tRNA uridine 5-carboxymethylaminomethyl modification enzyme
MFDVVIIGGGHAGVEAALASARLNNKTLMIMGSIKKIASMPCNPSIGGPAKGIIVREIDALGGEMAKAIDATLLQVKMLNSSKGPAVRALRAQADKIEYPRYMKNVIANTENLSVLEAIVEKVIVSDSKVVGIVLEDGCIIDCQAVVIASGTYMTSNVLVGNTSRVSGPEEERTSSGLSDCLKSLGFELMRLKTGTPPRVKRDSIDYSKTTPQYGDNTQWKFSNDTIKTISIDNQVPCYLTYTTSETHQLIHDNLHLSSMYSGLVKGVGPRYCPSIEDKIVRFADKERHQVFIEPEGLNMDEMYIQGLSTSFPHDIQEKLVRSVPGLENAVISKYAYAIEYDAINPMQLKNNLESKLVENLFFAGQVNGTSGYEEAACQGIMAGINASLKINNQEPLVFHRDEAYIGVLIDDLITKGVKDPYRLLTSRAEFRLLLRHDNSEARLLKYGHQIGLVNDERYNKYLSKETIINDTILSFKNKFINPKNNINEYLSNANKSVINTKISYHDFLKRPEIDFNDLVLITSETFDIDDQAKDEILIAIKYEGYIQKEYKNAKKLQVMESKKIPDDIDYDVIVNIAYEAKDKLKKVKPSTISQASRISGVNPSDISVLLVYLESRKKHE